MPKGEAHKDYAGMKFGRLTALEYVPGSKWLCQCECGNQVMVSTGHLVTGHTASCGCLKHEKWHLTHGKRKTRLYRIWSGMKNRCTNENTPRYPDWGGRGIKVCDEWLHDFQAFWDWSMSHGYSDELSIDRIDNDGDYSPDNCRWATPKEQRTNQRTKEVMI